MLLLLVLACTPSEPSVCDVAPVGEVSLPADDAAHEESVEWWYWTGHLQDDDGRWYGFEHTFFAMDLGPYQATSVHLALVDVDAAEFDTFVVYQDGAYGPAEEGFDLALAGQAAVGVDGKDTLSAAFGDVGWDLSLTSRKAPVLQHGDGYHDYAEGGYTWYYSRERIDATGTLTVGGEERRVTGEAWFDHQWGDLFSASQEGWDWFAIQLDDDTEIMLFLVRGSEDVIGGSMTDAGCHTREIAPAELSVKALGEWTSPETGCTYPVGWEVSVGELELVLTPVLEEQEVVNDFKTYWEGAHTVGGDKEGRAYVELAGYCP